MKLNLQELPEKVVKHLYDKMNIKALIELNRIPLYDTRRNFGLAFVPTEFQKPGAKVTIKLSHYPNDRFVDINLQGEIYKDAGSAINLGFNYYYKNGSVFDSEEFLIDRCVGFILTFLHVFHAANQNEK